MRATYVYASKCPMSSHVHLQDRRLLCMPARANTFTHVYAQLTHQLSTQSRSVGNYHTVITRVNNQSIYQLINQSINQLIIHTIITVSIHWEIYIYIYIYIHMYICICVCIRNLSTDKSINQSIDYPHNYYRKHSLGNIYIYIYIYMMYIYIYIHIDIYIYIRIEI